MPRPPQPLGTRLLTSAEIRDPPRSPCSTVYELARSRRTPFLKVGRRTLFDPQLIAEWISTQNVPPQR